MVISDEKTLGDMGETLSTSITEMVFESEIRDNWTPNIKISDNENFLKQKKNIIAIIEDYGIDKNSCSFLSSTVDVAIINAILGE